MDVPLEETTTRQAAHEAVRQSRAANFAVANLSTQINELAQLINERFDTMTDAFDRLDTEVRQDISDDSARDALIQELRAANAGLAQQATDAVARADLSDADAAKARSDLDAAVQRANSAADALAGSAFNAGGTDTPPPADGGGDTPPPTDDGTGQAGTDTGTDNPPPADPNA